MRTPLGANQTVTLTHTVRKGTESNSYTVVLSGVSCHEVRSVHVETPGFARQEQTSFCIFPGHTTAAFSGTPEQASIAGSTLRLSPRKRSRPQRPRSGGVGGRWHRRTKFSCPAGAPGR